MAREFEEEITKNVLRRSRRDNIYKDWEDVERRENAGSDIKNIYKWMCTNTTKTATK